MLKRFIAYWNASSVNRGLTMVAITGGVSAFILGYALVDYFL